MESPGKYERVSGSSIGGGTYWGLCRLLTRVKSFDEVLDLAESGEADVVDMTVGDIYGRYVHPLMVFEGSGLGICLSYSRWTVW